MNRDLKIDVEDLLKRCQVENITDSMEEVAFSCPFPGHAHGDTRPSAYMNRDTSLWMCHGCKRRGNAVTFVAELEGVSPLKAGRWLREKYAPGFKEPEGGSMAKEWLEFETQPAGAVFVDRNPPLTPEQIGKLKKLKWDVLDTRREVGPFAYWFDRGFEYQFLQREEFVWDPLSERVCMTVRDEEGNVIGFKGRTHDPGVQPKYLVIGDKKNALRARYGFEPYKVTQVLHGLHDAKNHTDNRMGAHELIVCEGELNGAMMRQMGWRNTVGISGSDLSDVQADLIVRYCDQATLIFDSDNAGEVGLWGYTRDDGRHVPGAVEKLEKRIRVRVVAAHDRDPASMTKNEVHELLATAESSVARIASSV